jgi:hypothetical protein
LNASADFLWQTKNNGRYWFKSYKSKKNPKDHSTMNRRIVLNVAKRSLGGGFLARYDRGEIT